jgi:hypothetical protein
MIPCQKMSDKCDCFAIIEEGWYWSGQKLHQCCIAFDTVMLPPFEGRDQVDAASSPRSWQKISMREQKKANLTEQDKELDKPKVIPQEDKCMNGTDQARCMCRIAGWAFLGKKKRDVGTKFLSCWKKYVCCCPSIVGRRLPQTHVNCIIDMPS